jgi:hypothetical protein
MLVIISPDLKIEIAPVDCEITIATAAIDAVIAHAAA